MRWQRALWVVILVAACSAPAARAQGDDPLAGAVLADATFAWPSGEWEIGKNYGNASGTIMQALRHDAEHDVLIGVQVKSVARDSTIEAIVDRHFEANAAAQPGWQNELVERRTRSVGELTFPS